VPAGVSGTRGAHEFRESVKMLPGFRRPLSRDPSIPAFRDRGLALIGRTSNGLATGLLIPRAEGEGAMGNRFVIGSDGLEEVS
jgi:hypothetical protein